MRLFLSKVPPAALYSELKPVNDLFEFSSKWEQASRMALGSDTCRHILQTALLNCGLERTGTELRNVHTGRRAVGSWGGSTEEPGSVHLCVASVNSATQEGNP